MSSMGMGPMPGKPEAAIVALELRSPAAHYKAVEALCIAYGIAIESDDVPSHTLRTRLHEIARTLAPHVSDPADTLGPPAEDRLPPAARSPCQQMEDAGLTPTPDQLAREGRL